MSKWDDNAMSNRVIRELDFVHLVNPNGHHFGRPFVSSYQLAIAMLEHDADLLDRLGKELGGVGTGLHSSLSQCIGREL